MIMIAERIRNIMSSRLVRHSAVYALCDGINRAIPFLLLPLITYYLTPADYGTVTNFNVYMQILACFCYSCTATAVPVMYHKSSRDELRSFVSNMILINTAATILCAIVSVPLFGPVERGLDLPWNFQLYALATVWFTGISTINMTLWRCEERPAAFGIYQISQSALNAAVTVVLVVVLLLGWQGRVYAMMAAAILFGAASLVILYRKGFLSSPPNAAHMRRIAVFALPILPHALSFWFRGGVDKILLTNICGMAENGLYSVAMTWGAVVTMFLTAFNNAYVPYLYEKLAIIEKEPGEASRPLQLRIVRLIRESSLLTVLFVAAAYFVSAFLIKAVYSESFHAAVAFLPWVMLGQLFHGIYLMFVCFAHYTFHTKQLGIITFSLSLLQIGISWTLIRIAGAAGAALSSCIVGLLTCLCVSRLAMKVFPLPWNRLLH